MTAVTYADSRATLVAQLTTDLSAAGWTIYGSPPDVFDAPAVIVAAQEAERINPARYRRDVIVGLFVRRDAPDEAYDLIDGTVPALVTSLATVAGVTVGTVSRPEPITWTDVSYIAVFVEMTIETTL